MNIADYKLYSYFVLLLCSVILKTNAFRVRSRNDNKLDVIRDLNDLIKSVNEKSVKMTNRQGKVNRVLIKRLVPHNYESSAYEYDNAFNTIYRPLIRIDKQNNKYKIYANNNGRSNLLHKLLKQSDDFEIKQRLPKGLINPDDGYLLQPLKADYGVTENKIIKEVEDFIKHNNPKKVRHLTYSILRMLEKAQYGHDVKIPRSIVYIPPGQGYNKTMKVKINDAIHPGFNYEKELHQKPIKYWNYWTYDKEIIEDHCKGKTVQMGNICVQLPPH